MPPMRKNITTSSGSGVSTKDLPPQNLNQIITPNSTIEQKMLSRPNLPNTWIGLVPYFQRNCTSSRSSSTLGARPRPYLVSPWRRGRWPTGISVSRAPCWAA